LGVRSVMARSGNPFGSLILALLLLSKLQGAQKDRLRLEGFRPTGE